jgi:3-oxoacyl-[acyl-carrier-protein] synthase III
MSVPVPSCVNAARQALQKSGIGNLSSDSMSVGGTTATTRGYIVCVRLPKAGACNGDGATAVIVTAGDDAKALRDKINVNFAIPHLIDCG